MWLAIWIISYIMPFIVCLFTVFYMKEICDFSWPPRVWAWEGKCRLAVKVLSSCVRVGLGGPGLSDFSEDRLGRAERDNAGRQQLWAGPVLATTEPSGPLLDAVKFTSLSRHTSGSRIVRPKQIIWSQTNPEEKYLLFHPLVVKRWSTFTLFPSILLYFLFFCCLTDLEGQW